MPITEYFRILRRRWWIIVLMVALTTASAYAFSKIQTNVYKATIYVLIKPSRTDLGLTQSAKTLLRSYVAWLDTQTNAQKVVDTLKLDYTADKLRGEVTIASDDSRFVIQIDVKDQSIQIAGDVAQKWAELLQQWRDTENAKNARTDWVNAEVLGTPAIALSSPQTKVNTLAGAILGLVLGGVIIFVLEYLDAGILRSPQDVERALAASVLGTIPASETAPAKGPRARATGTSNHA